MTGMTGVTNWKMSWIVRMKLNWPDFFRQLPALIEEMVKQQLE
jgi:hypothetical protein